MNKRGQFYLIAALVIIGILTTLSATYTTTRSPKEETTIYNLLDEINFESNQVVDYGVFKPENDDQILAHIDQLATHYFQTNPSTDLIIVYGNSMNELQFLIKQNTQTGNVGFSFGGNDIITTPTGPTTIKDTRQRSTETETEQVTVVLSDDTRYYFNLRPGQMFFIALKKERQDETFIALPET